ncbi:MAG: SMC-Scp complex subunit ScpB [Thermoplasmata archaeon]
MSEGPDDLALRVEALLFAGGKPLAVRELGAALAIEDPSRIQAALRALVRGYSGRRTALELKRVGDRYALQLREEFVPVARSVTPMEMSGRTLKALTLVAYHQPMLQSFLVRMIGEGAYEEVQRLRGMGLLRAAPKGATLELTTTRAFSEYFGIASTRPEEIRRYLEQKLGPVAVDAGAAVSADASTERAPPAPTAGSSDGPDLAAAPPAGSGRD